MLFCDNTYSASKSCPCSLNSLSILEGGFDFGLFKILIKVLLSLIKVNGRQKRKSLFRSHVCTAAKHSLSICEYLISVRATNLDRYDMTTASSISGDCRNKINETLQDLHRNT